jgi:hypothetical protein
LLLAGESQHRPYEHQQTNHSKDRRRKKIVQLPNDIAPLKLRSVSMEAMIKQL